MNAFDSSITREEREAWFAHTPPWDRIASPVIDAILDGIADKALLEAFVQISMEQNLVTQYETLGREITTPDVTRARLSQNSLPCWQPGHYVPGKNLRNE